MTASSKNTSSGSCFVSGRTAPSKQQTHIHNASNAQYVASLISTPNTMVHLLPYDVSVKNENVKKGKERRFFMMESPMLNMIFQLLYGPITDAQHQTPISTSFNGLATERGIGVYTLARQLKGQGFELRDVEEMIKNIEFKEIKETKVVISFK